MNARIALVALLALWPVAAVPQGFAGMGAEAEGFALPEGGRGFAFPEDHGAHPDYRIEWWYVTANLTDAEGRDLGLQWTLFRNALQPGERPGFDSPQVWMGHAAVTTPEAHFVAERFARGGIGQAGVVAEPFDAWIDEWRAVGPNLNDITLTAQGHDFAYEIRLEADGPFVPQGEAGFSVKSQSGQASYYYSQPFYRATGTLMLPEGPVAVTGQAWLDREWSSQPLAEDQTGWDWFSLHLDSGEKVMGFQLRQTDGGRFSAATWIAADGTPTPLPDGAFVATPLARAEVAGREVPVHWRVEVPQRGLDVEVRAVRDDAWMDTAFPYWEGPLRITGSHGGRGYLEMTGYD